MNSRVSWSVEGIEPSVRERAEAAARRAGMSLGDWLNSTIGDRAPNPGGPTPEMARVLPGREAEDVAEIHQRLDSITRQIDQISRPGHRGEPAVARQLNDAVSRLDARLSQISDPAAARATQQKAQRSVDAVERAAAELYSNRTAAAPTGSAAAFDPASLEFAIAEITARQYELDDFKVPTMPARSAPPIAPASPAGPDMSGLQQRLVKITGEIEALQRPDGIEQSIASLRNEIAEIRGVITEAMPRRAIESIENEIRSLSKRIDASKNSAIDGHALAGVERALGEIREVLGSLTPAEQLAGFDEAIRNLGGKIDLIVRSSDDPRTLEQLEGAIAAMRAIVSNVASNEALGRLSDDVHMLSTKVDQLAHADHFGGSFAALEQRIAALTTTMESREIPAIAVNADHLEGSLRALSDRLDHMAVGNDSSATFAHLEQRVSHLLERLDGSTDGRPGNFSRVEDGLQDILRHLEQQQSTFAAPGESRGAPVIDSGLVDTIKRELSDMRFSQSETDRHTQDSLEVVHSTLGHVVDRLAMIEGDLRAVRAAPVVAAPAPVAPVQAPFAAMPTAAQMPPARPAMPNPVQSQLHALQMQEPPRPKMQTAAHFDAAPREFAATAMSQDAAPAFTSKAISDILDPQTARTRHGAPVDAAARAPDVDLPPDHPLEPGTRPPLRGASPSERIAASEDAVSELSSGTPEPASASSFIAAARRAAQAAAAAAPGNDKARSAAKPPKTGVDDKAASTIGSKIRSLLVGASVVVIVLGSFKMAMTLLDGISSPIAENASQPIPRPTPLEPAPEPKMLAPARPANPAPSMTSPTPIGRQSLAIPTSPMTESGPSTPMTATALAVASASNEITGTVDAPPATTVAPMPVSANRKPALVAIPATERLPDAIGGPALRAAALKGDAAAAYEIGLRYADGKGVPANFDEAAKWYDRAAQAGVVPAMFRIGTLYEKGLSVKKDIDIARRYYVQAADRGNAKAMHNLAVLEADGGAKGANYKSASQWFRKAADRGVSDSQFNLGILYARGIGVEQNLAESFKWFSLAAAQGDADSGRKRDDIAKRLDPQSLAAAKLAIQTFVPEPQPDDAVNVASPPGGWDVAAAPAAAKPAAAKRAAR